MNLNIVQYTLGLRPNGYISTVYIRAYGPNGCKVINIKSYKQLSVVDLTLEKLTVT